MREENFQRRLLLLALTFLSLTLALGTRNYDPLFLLPTLFFSQFLVKRGRRHLAENILFVLLLLFSYVLVFHYYYPEQAQTFAKEHLEVSTPLQLLGFGLFGVIKNLFLRNSLLYTLAALGVFIAVFGTLLFYFKRKESFLQMLKHFFIHTLL